MFFLSFRNCNCIWIKLFNLIRYIDLDFWNVFFFQEDVDQNEVEGTELIDKNMESNVDNTQTRIKLPNPFRKSKIEEDGKISIKFVFIQLSRWNN